MARLTDQRFGGGIYRGNLSLDDLKYWMTEA